MAEGYSYEVNYKTGDPREARSLSRKCDSDDESEYESQQMEIAMYNQIYHETNAAVTADYGAGAIHVEQAVERNGVLETCPMPANQGFRIASSEPESSVGRHSVSSGEVGGSRTRNGPMPGNQTDVARSKFSFGVEYVRTDLPRWESAMSVEAPVYVAYDSSSDNDVRTVPGQDFTNLHVHMVGYDSVPGGNDVASALEQAGGHAGVIQNSDDANEELARRHRKRRSTVDEETIRELEKIAFDTPQYEHYQAVVDRMLDKSNKPLRCFFCKSYGHKPEECENEEISKCVQCSRKGHTFRRCPESVCLRCLQVGHKVSECRERPYRTKSVCFRCRMLGHNRAQCPDQWRQFHLTVSNGPLIGGDRKQVKKELARCYNCIGSLHFGHDCPEEFVSAHGDEDMKMPFDEHVVRLSPIVSWYDFVKFNGRARGSGSSAARRKSMEKRKKVKEVAQSKKTKIDQKLNKEAVRPNKKTNGASEDKETVTVPNNKKADKEGIVPNKKKADEEGIVPNKTDSTDKVMVLTYKDNKTAQKKIDPGFEIVPQDNSVPSTSSFHTLLPGGDKSLPVRKDEDTASPANTSPDSNRRTTKKSAKYESSDNSSSDMQKENVCDDSSSDVQKENLSSKKKKKKNRKNKKKGWKSVSPSRLGFMYGPGQSPAPHSDGNSVKTPQSKCNTSDSISANREDNRRKMYSDAASSTSDASSESQTVVAGSSQAANSSSESVRDSRSRKRSKNEAKGDRGESSTEALSGRASSGPSSTKKMKFKAKSRTTSPQSRS